MSVRVLNGPALRRAIERAAAQMRLNGTEVVKLVTAEAMVQVSDTVPIDEGRLASAYGFAAGLLGYPGGITSNYVEGDAEVNINEDGEVEVIIHTPHWVFIELGTATIAPGLQVATAMEAARRRLIYGRGPSSLRGQLAAGWQQHISSGE